MRGQFNNSTHTIHSIMTQDLQEDQETWPIVGGSGPVEHTQTNWSSCERTTQQEGSQTPWWAHDVMMNPHTRARVYCVHARTTMTSGPVAQSSTWGTGNTLGLLPRATPWYHLWREHRQHQTLGEEMRWWGEILMWRERTLPIEA